MDLSERDEVARLNKAEQLLNCAAELDYGLRMNPPDLGAFCAELVRTWRAHADVIMVGHTPAQTPSEAPTDPEIERPA